MPAEPVFGSGVARAYDDTRALPHSAIAELQRRLSTLANVGPATRVLDAGAGTGLLAEALHRTGCTYLGVDSSRSMLQAFAARRPGDVALLQADLRALPLAADSVDVVLAARVFGVVPGWRRSVAECLRVLRPGGRLVVGRVERAEGSLHAVVRDLRNAWLAAHGVDADRPGAGDETVLGALSALADEDLAGEPIRWMESLTPSEQLSANLSGWRVQALAPGLQAELRTGLGTALAERYGRLDEPLRESAELVLHAFRKGR